MRFQNTASNRPSPETVSKKKNIFLLRVECFCLTYFLIGDPEAAGAIGDCAPEGMRKSELQVKNSKSSKLFNEV